MGPLARVSYPVLLVCLVLLAASGGAEYTNFETVPVRPLALSPDGRRLCAVNTPDGYLEIFDISRRGLSHRVSVPVGLEPVAVALRTNSEAWVVNHLSDSVSIVDLAAQPPRVVRTLLVGDAPWDVVFGGPRSRPRGPFPRAFISAARRGQNHPENPNAQQKTPGIGRADVWVFDAENLGAPLGGTPETIVQLFGDKPRPLAVSADGAIVYVGVFHSGSRTTTINQGAVCDGGEDRGPCTFLTVLPDDPVETGEIGTGSPPVLPGGFIGPDVDAQGNPAEEVGIIVKWNEGEDEWQDLLGGNWNGAVPFRLPDLDVFAIDALAAVPQEIASYPDVGTILFNMAVHRDGRIFVSNTEANNLAQLIGFPNDGYTTLRGRLHEAQISILSSDGGVEKRHLNKHIEYTAVSQPSGTADRSLATPHQMAFSRNGRTLYLAAFGSQKVGVFNVAELSDDSFVPDLSDHIELSHGGPAGLVVGRRHRRLYVYTRFDNGISIVDTKSREEIGTVLLHNPEPAVVRDGRPFLYDARLSSSNGEASCSSCHVHGDMDDLAWNLGNPADVEVDNPNPMFLSAPQTFHPLKGPMTTQTLRGLANHGPMHWRGDQTGGFEPGNGDGLDELAAFRAFNGAFGLLLGRDEGPLSAAQMQAFAEFGLTIFPPPNPIRPLNNRDTGALFSGKLSFLNTPANIRGTCDDCHGLEPDKGFFGTRGLSVHDPGDFKIPHLRNIYEKVGLFGFVGLRSSDSSPTPDQIRGFGLTNDGSIGDIDTFLTFAGFEFSNSPTQKSDVEDFVVAFPSNMAPIVGQQVTLSASSDVAVGQRIDLMIGQARTEWIVEGNHGPMACDLTVRGVIDGEARGWFFDKTTQTFTSDLVAEGALTDAQLRVFAEQPGQELTYTCAPPGSGSRVGTDRDDDGTGDRDEIALYLDPAAAGSVPGACSDGVDNDGDGGTDSDDADCRSPAGNSELSAPLVKIDIHPRRRGRRAFGEHATIPVAVLGSRHVDVRFVNPGSLALGPDGAAPVSNARLRDLNNDGYPDLVVRFGLADTGLHPGRRQACVTGEVAGSEFQACDFVLIRN